MTPHTTLAFRRGALFGAFNQAGYSGRQAHADLAPDISWATLIRANAGEPITPAVFRKISAWLEAHPASLDSAVRLDDRPTARPTPERPAPPCDQCGSEAPKLHRVGGRGMPLRQLCDRCYVAPRPVPLRAAW